MALVNEFRAEGISSEIDLPTIVVAGNQSSGKSSLIEAISGTRLIRQYTKDWDDLAQDLLGFVFPVVHDMVETVIDGAIKPYDNGPLPAVIGECLDKRLDALREVAKLQIAKMTALEAAPFTANEHYLGSVREKIFEYLRQCRYKAARDGFTYSTPATVTRVLSDQSSLGYGGLQPEDLTRLNRTTEYEKEMALMAETRAYWQVAYKHIIDNVPRIIDAELIKPLARELQCALFTDLEPFSEQGRRRSEALLAESDQKKAKREDFVRRRERLNKAKRAIRKFGQM